MPPLKITPFSGISDNTVIGTFGCVVPNTSVVFVATAVHGAAHVNLCRFVGAEYERRVSELLRRYLNPAGGY